MAGDAVIWLTCQVRRHYVRITVSDSQRISGSLDTVGDALMGRASPLIVPPRDAFRPWTAFPRAPVTGPTETAPDVYERAALQERARADHHETLRLLKGMLDDRGRACLFNNNVDLLATFGGRRYLVEVKSLARPVSTVDRMRYGMGQLFDYSVRYRAGIGRQNLYLPLAQCCGPMWRGSPTSSRGTKLPLWLATARTCGR